MAEWKGGGGSAGLDLPEAVPEAILCWAFSPMIGSYTHLRTDLGEDGGEGAGGAAGGDGVPVGGGRSVEAVDADVEAGLLELFLDVDLSGLHEGKEIAAHPGDLRQAHAALGEVDGLACEVRRGGVAFGWGGVAVEVDEVLLELDGANGGVDLERFVEAASEVARDVTEELRGPGAGVASVEGEAIVDGECGAGGEGDEHAPFPHGIEVGVILYAAETVLIGHLILVEENGVRADEGGGHEETAVLVVKTWKRERFHGGVGDGGKLRSREVGGTDDGDDGGLGAEGVVVRAGSEMPGLRDEVMEVRGGGELRGPVALGDVVTL